MIQPIYRQKQLVILLGSIMCFGSGSTIASDLTTPNTFSSGQTVSSSEFNQNFSAIETAINDNDARVTTNAAGVSTNAAGISTNAAGISTNAAGISTNAAGISTNAAGISANAAAATTNANSIGVLNNITNNFSGYAINYAVIGAKNVIVLRATKNDGAGSDDDYFKLVIDYENNTEQVSVNGGNIKPSYISKRITVVVDENTGLQSINASVFSMETPDWSDYYVEHSTYDPVTLVQTVYSDDGRTTRQCSNIAMITSCVNTNMSISNSEVVSITPETSVRSHKSTFTINGMTFNDVIYRHRIHNNTFRVDAKAIGRIYVSDSDKDSGGYSVIYYNVDGKTGGSLLGTPFGVGGDLDGLFF